MDADDAISRLTLGFNYSLSGLGCLNFGPLNPWFVRLVTETILALNEGGMRGFSLEQAGPFPGEAPAL
jgi:hypothetical protein